jgi:predicted GH43/DUF377 family glycosyl hydrolase
MPPMSRAPSFAQRLPPWLLGLGLAAVFGVGVHGPAGDSAAPVAAAADSARTDAPYAVEVPPRPDPIAEAWREAASHPPRPRTAAEKEKGKDDGPRPWERPNTIASTSLCEKFPHNPVLLLGKKGSLDAGHAEYPSVVMARGLFWLFYSAYGAHHRWEIAAAVAPDGINWTKLGVVFAPDTTAAAWDSTTIAFPSVIVDPDAPPDERFRMWYAGKRGAPYDGFGYATSPNGRDWRRRGCVLAVGPRGDWDGAQIVDPCVVRAGGGYRMYYCGSRDADGLFAVGLALSGDGLNWVKYPDNPIYDLAGDKEHRGLYTADVMPRGDGSCILFASAPSPADEYEVHAVFSADGFSFKPEERQVVLAPSRDGTWDDAMVYGMDGLERGEYVYLWFNGIYDRNVTQGGEVGLARVKTSELLRLLAVH